MSLEIERKFLVLDSSYRENAVEKLEMAQGYICRDPESTVRVRVADSRGYITVKTRNRGAVRGEWEFEIPLAEARELLAEVCGELIEKTRYIVPGSGGLHWEVDEFRGKLSGLVVAEIELPAEDAIFDIPAFVGKEVTGDARYYNSNLLSSFTTFST